jgi:general stress protein YciG
MDEKPKGSQGFASMSLEQRREIQSKGGKAAWKKGTAHRWTSEEAKAAGEKGGNASAVVRLQKKHEQEDLARAERRRAG